MNKLCIGLDELIFVRVNNDNDQVMDKSIGINHSFMYEDYVTCYLHIPVLE
jgi:hypothetical protein